MNPNKILDQLNHLGIKIWIENEKLQSEPRKLDLVKQQLWEAMGR